jgi:glycosyltransferase involved in cell wall biosynthesis
MRSSRVSLSDETSALRQSQPAVSTKINILLIENSIGHSGSAISLCNLVANLDDETYLPFVIFSRDEQLTLFREQFNSRAEALVVRRPPELKTTSFGRALGTTAKNVHPVIARVVYGLFSLIDLFSTFTPYVFRMATFARRRSIDLIHQNNGFDISAVLLAGLLRKPLLAYQRGSEWNSPLTRYLARFVDFYVANSQQTWRDLRKLAIPPEKISVITPPVDLGKFDYRIDAVAQRREFEISETDLCFGIVGTLLPWKGHGVFLKAAQSVISRVPTARAFVIGGVPSGADANYERKLHTLAADLGIADRIVFTGFRNDVPALIQMQRVIVHASIRPEPFGRVIIEAMAMKKPVIASKAGGPLEIIDDGINGFLVKPGDDVDLADRICLLLKDPERAVKIGHDAYLKTRRCYTVEAHVEAVSKVYQTILTHHGFQAHPKGHQDRSVPR